MRLDEVKRERNHKRKIIVFLLLFVIILSICCFSQIIVIPGSGDSNFARVILHSKYLADYGQDPYFDSNLIPGIRLEIIADTICDTNPEIDDHSACVATVESIFLSQVPTVTPDYNEFETPATSLPLSPTSTPMYFQTSIPTVTPIPTSTSSATPSSTSTTIPSNTLPPSPTPTQKSTIKPPPPPTATQVPEPTEDDEVEED